MELPMAPMGRLLKDAGAARVSDDARAKLAYVLEDFGMLIAQNANDLAKHAGRKTVTAVDIAASVKSLKIAGKF